jgi:membrane protease YdiL (CAAX protease family)
MTAGFARILSISLICASSIVLIALQSAAAGWLLLVAASVSLLWAEKKFAREIFLIIIGLAILGLTPINTDISVRHMAEMGATLVLAVALPYGISRFLYRDHVVQYHWLNGRKWYKSEYFYIALTALISYFLLPYYLKSTGAYLNWPSSTDAGSVSRLFIGTNTLGIWDELFFVNTVLGLLRRHVTFFYANIIQAILFTSFLYELGFTGWGPAMIFPFALLQGYIFMKTQSLFYVITIHLTLDAVLFLAIIYAHHPQLIPIFIF